MNGRTLPSSSASSGVLLWNIYLGSSIIHSMELSPNNTLPVEVFQQEFNSIKNCLLLACKTIPACPDYITDHQFLHGPACQHLPETAYHRDRWVLECFMKLWVKCFSQVYCWCDYVSLALPASCCWRSIHPWAQLVTPTQICCPHLGFERGTSLWPCCQQDCSRFSMSDLVYHWPASTAGGDVVAEGPQEHNLPCSNSGW